MLDFAKSSIEFQLIIFQMANGVPGQAGQSAASLAKAESERGQDCATSRGPIQKDFHALETAQMN